MTPQSTYSGELVQDAALPLADRFGDAPRRRATLNHLTVPSPLRAASTPHVSTHSEAVWPGRADTASCNLSVWRRPDKASRAALCAGCFWMASTVCPAPKGTNLWRAAPSHSDRASVRSPLISCCLVLLLHDVFEFLRLPRFFYLSTFASE